MLFALLVMFIKEMADTKAVVCNHQDTDQRLLNTQTTWAKILVTLSWDTQCSTHIAIKRCASSLPVLNVLLLWCQLEKNNLIEEAENISTVPTNVTSTVAMRLEQRLRFLHTEPPPACIPNSMFARCTFTIFFLIEASSILTFRRLE